MVALQYCVGFCHTPTGTGHGHTHVPSLLNLPLPPQCLCSVLEVERHAGLTILMKIIFYRGLTSLLLCRHLQSFIVEPWEQSLFSSQAVFKMCPSPLGTPSEPAWALLASSPLHQLPGSLCKLYLTSSDLFSGSYIILSWGTSILPFNISVGFYMQRLEFLS